MGYKDDDSSYSGNDNEEEDHEDDSHHNRSNNSSQEEEEFIEKLTSKPSAGKRRRLVDKQMNSDDQDEERVLKEADTKSTKNMAIVRLKPDELYVDWGDILHTSVNTKSWWVHQPFINHNLPLIEIDKLIGYSTHITTYHHPCTSSVTTSKNTSSTTNATMGRTFQNPLLGLPNIPIRPTLLKHLILNPATKLTTLHVQERQQQHFQNNLFDDDDDDCNNDDDVNIDDHPLRPKKKQKTVRDRKKIKRDSEHSLFYERFHHSAAMAIGMFIEEMITATLLPLAQQYVQYCRHHHDTDGANNDSRLWTLPPEEAIMKLFNDSNGIHDSNTSPIGGAKSLSSLLSTRIPTRSIVSGAIGTSLLNQPSMKDHERIAYRNWCGTTPTHSKIQQQWIDNDPAFFQLLIQNIPLLQRPVSTLVNNVDDTTPTLRPPTATATITAVHPDTAPITNQVAYEI